MEFSLAKEHINGLEDGPVKDQLEKMLQFAEEAAAKIVTIINTVFAKTQIIVGGTVPEQGATIETLLDGFKKVASEKGIANICVNPNITGWFPKEKVTPTVARPSRLVRFVSSITHAKVVENTKALNVYQEVTLSDGIQRATELVKAGELDQANGLGVIIYLTNRKHDTPCKLYIWRDWDGELELDVYYVDPDGQSSAGIGVLVSENFQV